MVIVLWLDHCVVLGSLLLVCRGFVAIGLLGWFALVTLVGDCYVLCLFVIVVMKLSWVLLYGCFFLFVAGSHLVLFCWFSGIEFTVYFGILFSLRSGCFVICVLVCFVDGCAHWGFVVYSRYCAWLCKFTLGELFVGFTIVCCELIGLLL